MTDDERDRLKRHVDLLSAMRELEPPIKTENRDAWGKVWLLAWQDAADYANRIIETYAHG